MERTTIKDFIIKNRPLTLHICQKCNSSVELVINNYQIIIDDYSIEIDKLPQMQCISCNGLYLTEESKGTISYLHDYLIGSSRKKYKAEFIHEKKRYKFCEKYNFNYDYLDYENIPGLTATAKDGFLTPVFFKKTSLIYFMHHPEYELVFDSETYGTIRRKKNFSIPFGINRTDKLVMWLGDLDRLDNDTLSYLKIHNIESDHQLIESEFYRGQLCCEFSEPIKEIRIINLRNEFYFLARQKLKMDLNHLDKEVIAVLENIKKPVIISEDTIKPVISSLHKILIEAVKLESFKEFYYNNITPIDKAYKDWGSIKLYEYLVSYISSGKLSEEEIKKLSGPLYLLNDLRIYYFHIISDEKQNKIKNNIVKSLNLTSFDDTFNLYSQLLDRLYTFYDYLVKNLKSI